MNINLRLIVLTPVFVLMIASVLAQKLPPVSRTVYKCGSAGKYVYSDSPCLGAQKIDVEPTRGLSKDTGKDVIGADVRREVHREQMAEALRPLTGMNAKQLDVYGRRMKLSPEAQRQCRQLDADLPLAEKEEKRTAKTERSQIQAHLFAMRKEAKTLGC
jgi:hypothetical protein